MDEHRYEGRSVVVTGAASGVGAALLDVLAELGATDVTAIDRVTPTGPHAAFVQTDLSEFQSVERAIGALPASFDVLVNNAGVADTSTPETVFAVNALAPIRLTRALLPRLRHGGAIVLTSSVAGLGWHAHLEPIKELLAIEGWDDGLGWFRANIGDGSPYALSKEVLQVLAMWLAPAAVRAGVRINGVCPAPIETPLLADFRRTMTDEVIDFAIGQAGGTTCTAREVAQCLAWLGSAASSYVNGVNLSIDGGFSGAMTTGQLDLSALGF